MENTIIDLSKKTLDELKSLAYDYIAMKEIAEANLRTVNDEIAKKQKENADKIEKENNKNTIKK
jgi:hypothetical protein